MWNHLWVVLTASLALVLTYRCARYWLWFEQETLAGAHHYARLRSWSVRASDLDETRAVLREIRQGVTWATLGAWWVFLVVLNQSGPWT